MPKRKKKYILGEIRVLIEFLFCFLKVLFSRSEKNQGKKPTVMVITGLGTGDGYTFLLRWFLKKKGCLSYKGESGFNQGNTEVILPRLEKKLKQIYNLEGKVTLLGWSLGGVYSLSLYSKHPEKIKKIITLGSPLKIKPGSNIDWVYPLISGKNIKELTEEINKNTKNIPSDTPLTSIYSKTDGVVPAEFCFSKNLTNINYYQVGGSHLGLPFNFQAFKISQNQISKTQ